MVILSTEISQGSVVSELQFTAVTRLRWGGSFCNGYSDIQCFLKIWQ